MLVADDYHLEAGGAEYRSALIVFFVLCAVSGVPLSWNKTAGGDVVSWVGFELLHRSCKVGLTSRRAEWFVRWTREVAGSRTVNMSSFEEGLGRVMYVAGALEYERPFLAPLYKFLSLHPRGSVRTVPAFVAFFLDFLATQIEECRHTSCVQVLLSSTCAPRVDAQASETRTGIGGWLTTLRADGTIDTMASPWFSLEIREEDFPWIFEKSCKPALVISTLEALAVLVALKVFVCKGPREHRTRVQVLPTWTDNRGNGSALNKLMTTKFPSSALMMELAVFMKKESIKASVQWAPRTANKEADALANGRTEAFSPVNERSVDPSAMNWVILDRALDLGRRAEEEIRSYRAAGRDAGRGVKLRRRKPEDRLPVTDPW